MTKLPDNLEKWINEKWPYCQYEHQDDWKIKEQEKKAAREAILYLLGDLGVMECLEKYSNEENYKQETYWAYPDGSRPSPFGHDPEGLVEFTSPPKVSETLAKETLAKINGGEG